MALSLLFNRKVVESISGINLDATIRQRHNFSSTVTSFPVEGGGNISDNIQNEPVILQIEPMISDNPIQLFKVGSDFIDSISGQASRSRTAAEELIRIERGRQTFTVVTGLRVYENMAFTELQFDYDEDTGKSIRFVASFKQIEISESRTVEIEREQLADDFKEQSSILDDGKQVAEDLPDIEDLPSLLRKSVTALVDIIRG